MRWHSLPFLCRMYPFDDKDKIPETVSYCNFYWEKSKGAAPAKRPVKDTLLPVVICMAVIAAVYFRVFFQGYWAVNTSDALNCHMPLNAFIADSFKRGVFPHWNPAFNLGQPLIDGFSSLFHPGVVLFMLFDPWTANTVEVIGGFYLTMLGMWFLLKEQRFGFWPCFIGTLVYSFAGPVFMFHSYHLAVIAISFLPWTVLMFHLYDRRRSRIWLICAAASCVVVANSLDPDTTIYFFGALAIDRVVCLPRGHRRHYVFLWSCIIFLSAAAASSLFVPLYEWLSHSSRFEKSYAGVMDPGFRYLMSAVLSNRWPAYWPYDPFYFYIGPASLWLAAAGLSRPKRKNYARRFFFFACIIPVLYITVRLIQHFTQSFARSFDAWRLQYIFCFGFSMMAAQGVGNLLRNNAAVRVISVTAGGIALWWAHTAFVTDGDRYSGMIYGIAAAGILTAALRFRGNRRWQVLAGIVLAVACSVVIPAAERVVTKPSCAWNHTVFNLSVKPPSIQCHDFMRNIPFYRRLARQENGNAGHWRVSLFGGTDNMTMLAGLRTVPNYTALYNREFEHSLATLGLIGRNRIHPYWIRLEHPSARELGLFGVRFLVVIDRPDPEDFLQDGWFARDDLSWPAHRVFENSFYRGRAYIVDAAGRVKAGVGIVQDDPEHILLCGTAVAGDRIVLADLDYPGWEAALNGSHVPTISYRECLRSVIMPESGPFEVRWTYLAAEQRKGFIISIIAVSALVLLVLSSGCGEKSESRLTMQR